MLHTYSQTGAELTPYTLRPNDHAAIGRLVAACAQLEVILTCWVARLSGTSVALVDILLGTTAVSAKEKAALTLAEIHGPETLALHNQAFGNDDWTEVFRCRNVVCHGIPLGKSEDDQIAFKTIKQVPKKGGKAVFCVYGYATKRIAKLAEIAEVGVATIEPLLGLQASLQTYRGTTLVPHPQGRRQGQTKRGDVPPPRSKKG